MLLSIHPNKIICMKLKTTVRYSKSVERVNYKGLKEWIGYELVEEHDGDADRDEIRKDIYKKVEEWHSGISNAGMFNPQTQFREPETLPVIQTNDR